MENIFVEFLPPWVETGLQPAFYDKESGTVLQQTARMYARVNMLIRMFNKLSKNTKTTVEDYINQFNELHDYVQDYFANLDVQEEINNKLDVMAEDGTLADIVAEYVKLRAVLSYNSVADMKLATNLYNGSFAETYGYYTAGDAGGAKYKVRTVTNDDVIDEKSIIALADDNLVAEYVPQGTNVYVKQFGAKGDGTTDDTTAIQACVDYSTARGLACVINTTTDYYKVTLPILLVPNNSISTQYWTSGASKLIGEHHGNCRIVKIGDGVYTNLNPTVNNVNATVIAYQTSNEGTGIVIDELSLENYTNTSYDLTNGSLGLWTNVSRSTYSNLNIKAYSGIRAHCFSNKFENIVIQATDTALNADDVTSTLFRFIYTFGCNNPYKIDAIYSTMENVCCDNCTGTIYDLSGAGLTLQNCGTESTKAHYIFKVSKYVNNLDIKGFFMMRQLGDAENSLDVNDCRVFFMGGNGFVNVDGLTILETGYVGADKNSYIFEVAANESSTITTSLRNLFYYKNYDGTSNPRMRMWKNSPRAKMPQRFSNPGMEFNYYVSNASGNKMYPVLGTYRHQYDVVENSVNSADLTSGKNIRLDSTSKYNGSIGNIQYEMNTQAGDLFLYNNPKDRNSLGYTVLETTNASEWVSADIPLYLKGASTSRPTSGLFDGLNYYDTTLGKPIWYNGSVWKDASGTTV